MKNQSELVRGAGMFINFFSVLAEELVAAGGQVEILYFAQKKHARPMMALLAKTIVDSKLWKIPASIILSEIENSHDHDEFLEYDKVWSWSTFSQTARELTTLWFVKDANAGYDERAVKGLPALIVHQIVKYPDEATLPPVVSYEGEEYIVTYWDNDALYLAPARNIDLDN